MIGVAIIAFNRPYYLRRLLKTLEAQSELDVEFHLFNDGAINKYSEQRKARDVEIAHSVRLFERAQLPNKATHAHVENIGIALIQREAIDYMTERFERVMVIEDDVLLSPHWFRLARLLFDEMRDYPDVFGFSPGFRRLCEQGDVLDNLGYVKPTTQHLWTECFTAQSWQRVQEHMTPFYDLVSDCDYGQRPREAIGKMHLDRGASKSDTSQDWARVVAIELAGMRRMQCVVNRGMSIGRDGVNFNGNFYEMMHLGEQTPYTFDADATREGFDWLAQ